MTNKLLSSFADSKHLQSLTQRLPEIFSVLLITGSAYTAANITWALSTQNDGLNSPAPASANHKTVKQANTSQVFRTISNAHLFGKTDVKPSASRKTPVSRLDLVLKGVLAANPMSLASAIIARKKNGAEESYSIGDRLPGNIVIKEIHADHVIIERTGQREKLQLQKESGSRNSARYSKPATSPNKRALNNIRNKVIKNPTSFAEYALPIAVKENGKQIGYRLELKKKGDIFKKAGLKSTDTITSINGMKLDSPRKSVRALKRLKTATQLNLVVRRNGSDVKLNLQLQ